LCDVVVLGCLVCIYLSGGFTWPWFRPLVFSLLGGMVFHVFLLPFIVGKPAWCWYWFKEAPQERTGPAILGSCMVTCSDVQSDVMSLMHTKKTLYLGPKTCLANKTTCFRDLILTPAKPRPKMHGFLKTIPEQVLQTSGACSAKSACANS
jgi:hypothetical protein